LVQGTKTGENIPNDHKIYKMAVKIPNYCKIYTHVPKYSKIGIFGM
jgi:hypothetical protein